MVTESFFLIILSIAQPQIKVIDFFPDMKSCQNAIKEISSVQAPYGFGKPTAYIEPYRMKCIPKQVD